MKYKRLTKRIAKDEEAFLFHSGLHEGIERLAELEDKIESGELVDRNEYIDRFMAAKDISGMTDKELEFFAKHNAIVREYAEAEIARLTAEVAELRASLDNAGKFPCKVGDTIYQTDTSGTRIFKSTVKNIIFETDGVAFDERAIGESIFLTEEAVKEKMKELQGGER